MSFQFIRRNARQAFLNFRLLVAVTLCSASLVLGVFAFNATAPDNALSVVGPRLGAATPSVASKIAPWVRDHTTNERQAEFLVVLTDQADLSEARKIRTKQERRRQVRDELWNKAEQTQRPILQWLRDRNIEHRPFYIVNAIWVKADAQTAIALAARSDVLRVEGNPLIRNNIIKPIVTMELPLAPTASPTPEPGIVYTHAPQVWSLGYTGQGIVVAGADTGVRWTHQALKNQYRGWNGTTANHDYNWHDSLHTNGGNTCGNDSPTPCDGDVDAGGHGTHTVGTAVGSDGGNNLIGMAPGARWIGCRNMDPHGNGTPARYIECMEFFLAPYPVGGTPAQGNPDLAPDISTNSWGCPTSEGCSADTLQAAVEAQRAAGIFMVVAAGNSGPNCNTIIDPPAIYDAVYTVGALNTGTDGVASFSSRGTVTVDGSSRLKPDLCAPGNPVRSAMKASNTDYGTLSGTSMATPHVAGAAALLWSAAPELRRDIDRTERILNAAAFPIYSTGSSCDNGTPPNNTYGYGRLDVKAAVDCAYLEIMPSNAIWNGNAITVTFYAGASLQYRLEYKDSLTDPDWLPVPAVSDVYPTVDGYTHVTDPYAGQETHRIYRVQMVR